MSKIFKSILKILNTIVVVLIVLLAVFVIGTKLLGIQLFTVLSGSMEPEYPTGSLILVKEIDPAELEIGDVITFKLGGSTTATHRIVEILPDANDPDNIRFRTKGDANEINDETPVNSDSIIGTPFITIPKAGYFMSYIQKPPGRNAAIAVGAALILFVIVTDFLVGDKKERKNRDVAENIAENN